MNETIQKLKDLINVLNYNLRTHSQDILPTLKEILSELEGNREKRTTIDEETEGEGTEEEETGLQIKFIIDKGTEEDENTLDEVIEEIEDQQKKCVWNFVIDHEANKEMKDLRNYERAMEFMKESWAKGFYNTKPEKLIKKAIDMWFIL